TAPDFLRSMSATSSPSADDGTHADISSLDNVGTFELVRATCSTLSERIADSAPLRDIDSTRNIRSFISWLFQSGPGSGGGFQVATFDLTRLRRARATRILQWARDLLGTAGTAKSQKRRR